MVLAASFIIVYQLETTQIFFSEWMVKHTEVHPCHGMFLSNKQEWSITSTTSWKNLQRICCCLVAKLCPTLRPQELWLLRFLSMGFLRQDYWSVLPFPSPGDLTYPGIEHASFRKEAPRELSWVKKIILRGYILYDPIYSCWNEKIMKWKRVECRLVFGRCSGEIG